MTTRIPEAPADLAATLPRAAECGVFRLAAQRLDELERALDATGLAMITLELGEVGDKASLMRAFAVACAFPDWFGGNWDALADALGDLSWLPLEDGWVLLLDGADAHRAAHPRQHAILLDVLRDTCAYWRESEVPFWAFCVVNERHADV